MRFGFDFLPDDASGGDTGPTVVERKYVDKVTASDGVTYDIQDTVALERANGYFIDYTIGSNNTLTAVNSTANKQSAKKILEVINAGVRPIVYARITKSLDHYTVPAIVDVGRGSTHTSFDLTFILSTGYDMDVLHNDTYDYEDHISVSGSNVTHTIHKTDLRATQVKSNADGNGLLYYWRLPLMYKRYEYFNASHYLGPIDEGNDYYQSAPFVIASCNDHAPADGSTFTANLSDFSTITQKYPELPPMLYISFKKYTEAGGTATGDAYWVPISKILHETGQSGSPTEASVKGFTGVFVDKDGNFWKATYDIETSTGTINAVTSGGGGGSVDKYDITITVYPTGIANTPTPRFEKCNGYTNESDITTQLHNLYTALVNGEHPIVTLNFLYSMGNNSLKTLCPVSVTPIDSTWLCLTWENSVPPASPSGGGLPATRYVHMCYVNHTGVRRYSYTQKTYSLT